jgi:hypothetical protein
MHNFDNQQFDYQILKVAYDSDDKIKDIIKDFNQDSIVFKTSEMDDLKLRKSKSKNTISSMAKKAVDLKGL